MSDEPLTHEPTRPSRRAGRIRVGRRAVAALAALTALVALAGCAGTTERTPPPVPPPAATATLEQADVDAWLDGMLPAALQRTGIAGAGVSVVHDGEVLTSRGYGWADTGEGDGEPVPVDPARTLFRPGSVSKVVTATAVMQLVEDGRLDLDTDVTEYLDFELPLAQGPVTLRHLLTHTAGFEERVDGLITLDGSPVDLRRALATDPPEQVYAPGTVPAYSNYGNALAGYVVERVTGVPFEEHVAEAVLEPAGMRTATFAQPLPAELAGQMSQGYPDVSSPAAPFEHVGVAPAGGLSATPDDMAAFMLAQLGEPVTGEPLLSPESLELMHAPALGADSLGVLAEGPQMSLGLFDESRHGQRILGHGGDTQFFHSHLQLYPEHDTGIFVSLNSNGTGPLDTIALRDSLMDGFVDRYFPDESEPLPTDLDPAESRERADLAAGSYVSSRSMHSTFLALADLFGTATVSVQPDGRLLLDPGQGLPPTLYTEAAPWVWHEVGGNGVLTVRTVDGEVTAIGTGPAFTLLPAAAERTPGVAGPVLVVSALVLLVSLLGWVVAGVTRLVRRRPRQPVPGTSRVVRLLTRTGVVTTVVALLGWLVTVQLVLGLQQVPSPALRVLQVLQALGALAVVPAALAVVQTIRSRAGGRRVVGAVLVLLALVGVAWFALTFRLLAPSVSY